MAIANCIAHYGCMYSHRERFNSDHNQKVLDDLIQEVKTLNDTYEVQEIKSIATYIANYIASYATIA